MPNHQVNDPRKGMKALIRPIMATGYAGQTIYGHGEAWKAANKYILGHALNHFCKSAITQVLGYGYG